MFCVILTLFPGAIRPYLDESILGIAQRNRKLRVELIDPRDFTDDLHRSVDDRPFGGGPGMVLKPEPIFRAVEDVERRHGAFHRILLSPRGRLLNQEGAADFATRDKLLLLCGRYEGFDERIRQGMEWDEVSLGEFVLAGGEIAALAVVESAARLLPGVLGCAESSVQESFQKHAPLDESTTDDATPHPAVPLLDCPHYTRPRDFRGMEVPDVLLSGDHGAVATWRHQQALRLTRARHDRPTAPRDIDPS